MIDTVWLLIPHDQVVFLTGEVFHGSSIVNGLKKFTINPTAEELMSGQYFPKVEAYSKSFYPNANVIIKFSAPKLLYQNNLNELTDADFQAVIDTLHSRLETKGIMIRKDILENATVSFVHFSKNIELKGRYTSRYVITEMGKVNIRKNFDQSRVKFSNNGDALHIHTESYEMVAYDKVSDLGKGRKRAADINQTSRQKELQEALQADNKEIIRFEIRLKKKKLNDWLEKLGYEKDPTFRQVFNSELSIKVVSRFWNDLIKAGSLGMFSESQTPEAILQKILLKDQYVKPKQAIYYVGLLQIIRSQGIRDLRSSISNRINGRTWYRIAHDIKRAAKLSKRFSPRWIIHIDRNLRRYRPYRFDPL